MIQIVLFCCSHHTVETMNALKMLIVILKINILTCLEVGDNDRPLFSTLGEYDKFSFLSEISGTGDG